MGTFRDASAAARKEENREDEKIRIHHQALEHLQYAKKERDYYRNCIKMAEKAYSESEPRQRVSPCKPDSRNISMHYFWDFAQQLSYPYEDQQVVPIYFRTPRRAQLESVEMIYKYSFLMNIPVTEETAFLAAELTEGNPFYISALFSSKHSGKDLATFRGVRETLEFETLNLNANINTTWMEYLDSAFSRINDVRAKEMVLYLSKERHRFVGRKELKQKLGLE
ncbi:MAG: hypothetical protein GY749_00135, partial [Desulfobacteraceae bacterium]|nr:hypothetical protein [Desulfobacteraceae bacterium]